MSTTKNKIPALKALYTEQVVPALVKSRGYKNKHEVPQIVKINLNTGIDAEADKTQIADIQRDLGNIAGQKPVLTKSRKAVSNFKLRQGQIVGAYVTLRGNAMWEFLYRLLAVALPTIRDFRGVPAKLDGRGNYNLGISDFTIFPEITVENVKKSMGLDIAITTTAGTDEEGRELLKLLGMPFRRTEQQIAAAADAAKKAAA
ncbi:50S ribosomal protein L5 [Opitutaceae bacterium TAV4]|uniref:50S ribosomal protein L5 n=1 Tax=Geminisphaera colitermitum TaxID=1148786 RepID=UPI0001964F85|nr:50S ribosomal protein L5 [Geminisphaera colitermitum]RRJ96079.1 50S ribosomal protein L5 [Opitutaceae bacterium TAV4]RRK00216.1 50S ribosomal protein L5 [Opitutaceae bacterium TAV3]